MNKKEGHDILLGGVANAAGYYNTFYIQAIGAFDSSVGSFVPDSDLIGCLNNYNAGLGTPVVNGEIMNISLQNSISMKVDLIVDDAKVLDTQDVFNF